VQRNIDINRLDIGKEIMASPEHNQDIDGKGIEPHVNGGQNKETTWNGTSDNDSKSSITFDLCRFCARPFPGCISLFGPEGRSGSVLQIS